MIYGIGIYLVGCIFSYLLFKQMFKKRFRQWLVSDRTGAIGICFFSWLAFIVMAFIKLSVDFNIYSNKPAKW